MSLHTGERFGAYEVLSPLGAGGMGEVYRARDLTLGRDVALKILPPPLAADGDRLARFRREAQMLAALNHPGIAGIYGVEESGGITALVLELVEGSTLADRIARGPLPREVALALARQMAEALEAAHLRGIIHRDLKPANIQVTADEHVKILDFGLAKVGGDGRQGLSAPAASTMSATLPGLILGTAAYMSPEQASGQDADQRSDVWAFGCVLFEMLTGRRAFPGDSGSETLAAVLKSEPEWDRLAADTPPGIRRLLRRCLQKDRSRRLRDIGDARLELDDVQASPEPERIGTGASSLRERVAWVSALGLVGTAAIGLWMTRQTPSPPPAEVRLEVTTPPSPDSGVAISLDGRRIAFTATVGARKQLWLRSLAEAAAQPLPGTDGASAPFWSPDGQSIGFFADNRLKRLDITGGSVQTVAPETRLPLGGAWNRNGTILFSTNPGRPLLTIPVSGGEPVTATRFEAPQQRSQSSPQFLPDNQHFLFYVVGTSEARGVYLGELGTLETTRLINADGAAVYAAGHLLFVRDGRLLAQRFDLEHWNVTGEPMSVAEPINAGATLSAASNGTIVYRTRPATSGQRQLAWIDRTGKQIRNVVYPDTAAQAPALSADGRKIADNRFADENMDIWAYDTERQTWDRVTSNSADDIFPLWSPDGRLMVFGSNRRKGLMNLFIKPMDGRPGSEELLSESPNREFPMDWSRDGRFLLYDSDDAKGSDIFALRLDGDRKPFPVVQTEFNEKLAQFSPDGRWIAYQSDKTGRDEIYLRLFDRDGSESIVSTGGGAQVRWNSNGRELFYIATDDRLMAVPLRFSSDGRACESGSPTPLFLTNVGSTAINTNRQQYMVSPGGQTFIMNSVLDNGSVSPIAVILNWHGR